MKIGLNLLAFLPGISGGIELYVANLLAALSEIDHDNDYYLITNRDNDEYYRIDSPRFHSVMQNVRARPQIKRVLWEQAYLPLLAHRLRLDVLHSPSYTWPVLSAVPGVVTICDMLYRDYPETIGEPKLTFWRILVPLSARRCKKVITISFSSKKAIVRYLGTSPEKVSVTPLALNRHFPRKLEDAAEIERVCRKYTIKRPYILMVGGLGWHKNPETVIRALRILRDRPETGDLSLVITGNDYGAKQGVIALASALNLTQWINLPGYVEKNELPVIYAGALAYTSPSYYEGFGLTILEAMSQGVPVVASNRYSLPEVAGDAAIIVQPDSVEEIVNALDRIASDPQMRSDMIKRGLARVASYSWEATAKATLQAYIDALV